MLNAAVWLGSALFFMGGVTSALTSQEVQALFREQYFDYFSGAVVQLVTTRFFYWHIVCALIALLHLLAEWLYLGRSVHRAWLGLLVGLLVVGLIGNSLLVPKLNRLHRTQHAINLSPEQRAVAAKSYASWHRAFQGINLLLLVGVAVYFWRATTPSDPLRFVGPTKFRS